MPEITIAAETGRATGSRPTRRLRAAGKIPGIVYGHGTDAISVAVDARELRAALSTDAGVNALLSLQVDGSSHLTMARVIQRHPVKHTVVHVDFQIVRRDEVMTVEVPVNLVGEAESVHRDDGVVAQEMYTLTVNATPDRIPHVIEVDISELAVGTTIRVADVKLPSGVSTDVDPESAVVVGQPPQVVALPEPAEGAEPEEGAEAAEAAEEAGAEAAGGAEEGGGGSGDDQSSGSAE